MALSRGDCNKRERDKREERERERTAMFKSHSSQKKRRSGHKKSTKEASTSRQASPIHETEGSDRLRLNWSRSECLDHGMFCGQCAVWGNTVYFKNGGSHEVYEYSTR